MLGSRRRVLSAALGVALLSGCGSTLTAGSAANQPQSSLGTDLVGVQPTTAPLTPGSTSSIGGQLPGVPSASTPQPGDAGQPPIDGSGNASATSQASTSRPPIVVGVLETNNDGAAAAGVNNGNTFTPRNAFDAMAKAWNSRGGLAGRKVTLVYAEIKSSSTSLQSDLQAACTKFTQDNHVALVFVAAGIYFESFTQCLAKAKIPVISTDYALGDTKAMDATPDYYAPTTITTNERMRLLLQRMHSAGLLTSKDKLGFFIEGCPYNSRTFTDTAVPTAKALGLTVTDSFTSRCFQGFNDLAGMSSDAVNASLRFKSRGVTHVFFISGGIEGDVVLVFLTGARSQNYFPKYGITSVAAPTIQESNTPKDELQNAIGLGWLPSLDTTRPTPVPAGQKACLKDLRTAAGLAPAGPADRFTAFSICDVFTVANGALQATSGSAAPEALKVAIHGLPSTLSLAAPLEGRVDFAGSRRTGPSRGRLFAWSKACGCFDYTGSSFSLTN